MSLSRALFHHASNRPDHPALVDPRALVDYRTLWARVAGTAREMHRRGLAAGDVVALALPSGADYLVALHALLLARAVVLPLHPGWPTEHRAELARFFGARGVVALAPDASAELHFGPDVFEHRLVNAPLPDETWDAPALVSNSSGTTGAYRGALLTHRHLLERIHARALAFGFSMNDRAFTVIEPHHAGSRNACLLALHAGATVVLKHEFESASAFFASAREEGATHMYLVPSMLRKLLAGASGQGPALPSLRCLFSSSDRLLIEERRLVRERLCANFYEGYATSEGGLVTLSTPSDQLRHEGAVGRPVLDVELEILDDAGRALPRGEIGHVRFRSASVPAGYYRNPDATAERFRDGWFYPGDLASQNADGYVFLKGRADETIVRDGVKFSPGDVERVLGEHPRVSEAAVVGVSRPLGSSVIVAFVRADGALSAAELVAYAAERLPPERRPSHVELCAELPRGELGKLARGELRVRAERLVR